VFHGLVRAGTIGPAVAPATRMRNLLRLVLVFVPFLTACDMVSTIPANAPGVSSSCCEPDQHASCHVNYVSGQICRY
jgi:hypothetical protein